MKYRVFKSLDGQVEYFSIQLGISNYLTPLKESNSVDKAKIPHCLIQSVEDNEHELINQSMPKGV